MCFPLQCLKIYRTFAGYISIIIGVTIAVGVSIELSWKKDFPLEIEDSIKQILITTLSFSVLMILIGILGFFGIQKKQVLCETIFILLNIAFSLIFLIIGLVSLIGSWNYPLTAEFRDPKKCIDLYPAISHSEEETLKIYKTFFCRKPCPCNTNFPLNDEDSAALPIFTSNSGKLNAQSCEGFSEKFNTDTVESWKMLEEQLSCAGVCTKVNWYIYSNVNRGMPNKNCMSALVEELGAFGKMFGIILLWFSGAIMLNILFICCLCFHPKKAEEIVPDEP